MQESLRKLLSSGRPPRILIVRLSSVGDVVHALPVATGLRKRFPEAYLAWVVEEKACQVVEKNPYLDEVIVFEKARWKKALFQKKNVFTAISEIRAFVARLREKKIDIAIDLQRLMRSGLITFFSGASMRVGFADAREFSHVFYNVKIPVPKKIHAVDRYFLAVKFFGSEELKPTFHFPLDPEEKSYADQVLQAHQLDKKSFVVGIFPTSSLPHKCWNLERFALLADALIEKFGAAILIFSGKYEEAQAQRMAQLMSHKPVLIPGDVNIRQMAALISRCHLFVSNDTGPLHIAVALKIPVIGLYGPFDPGSTGPYGEKSYTIYHEFPCAPCIRHPICQNYDCMRSISVDEVLQAVERLGVPTLSSSFARGQL